MHAFFKIFANPSVFQKADSVCENIDFLNL